MQRRMDGDHAFYWYSPSIALWSKHPSCACMDSIHLERPYAQPRLLEVFEDEASFLKPVCCVITHTLQEYVHSHTGIGLCYWHLHLNRLLFFSHRHYIQQASPNPACQGLQKPAALSVATWVGWHPTNHSYSAGRSLSHEPGWLGSSSSLVMANTALCNHMWNHRALL